MDVFAILNGLYAMLNSLDDVCCTVDELALLTLLFILDPGFCSGVINAAFSGVTTMVAVAFSTGIQSGDDRTGM